MSTQSIFRVTRSPRYETQWQAEKRRGKIEPMEAPRPGFVARLLGK